MSFKAGAITGNALLNTSNWDRGIKGISSSAAKVGGVLKNVAKIGFAAVAAGMTAAVYQANEYQKEFANVSTLTDQNTKALQDMSIGLLSLDSELGSTRELTKSMYDAISAGAKPGKEAFDVVTASAKFAKAAMTDNAASVKLLSATTNAYGKETISTEKASDIFFKTIEKGVITGAELSATIGKSIPLYASMNIPVEQLASGMAAMTKQGVNAAESTTQLNAIVNAFLKPSTALTEVLKEQGYQSGQAFIQANGLTGALELLQGATESGDYEIAQLTGNIRAMKGVLSLSGEGAKIYNETLKDMEGSAGAVNVAFGKQEKTFATLKNELGKTAILAGNVGKVFVDKVAGGAQSALESINEFIISGRAMEVMAGIASKVGGAFQVIKVFATEVYNLFEDNLNVAIEDIKDTFDELFGSTESQIDVFAILSEVVNVLGAGFNILISVVKLAIKFYMNLISIAIDVAKVLGNVWLVITNKKSWEDVKDTLLNVRDGFIELGEDIVEDAINVAKESQKQWDELTQNANDNSKKFTKAWKEGSEKAKNSVLKNGAAAISGVKGGNEEIIDDTEKMVELYGEAWNDLTESQKNAVRYTMKIQKAGMGIFNDTTEQGLEVNKTIWDDWNIFVKENLDTNLEKFEFWAEQVLQLLQITTSGLSDISSLYYQNEFDKLELSNHNQLMALENRYKQGLISEAEYNDGKEKLEQDALKKRNELAKKQFENEKKLALAGVWIDAATAAMGYVAWAANKGPAGWITAGIMIGAVTGMAIAKTVLIGQQQFVPEYAAGTDYHAGGFAKVNEKGGEIIDLPTGSRVIPHDLSEQMANTGKEISININNPVVRQESDINKIANAVSQVLGRQLSVA